MTKLAQLFVGVLPPLLLAVTRGCGNAAVGVHGMAGLEHSLPTH